ncbi:bifunctional diaminohydroxyphosphoribosylaminopyrimidine deaminase/5-amino-6-(5-phosphoribosylamino)uracil reductase RibD [Aureimonas sp. N4]|uniref:bifunctional diaminohydroxyphosphoribosylaminopyrimidine deaminase/5-amino-6-(5-phosphoribosylamino)uracil reductase RibD n=1 Tax=Aureimonas sp. N4 TaxID=1638165 RepID=UPI000780E506|nr:bifunctional diaminohydroxyphosphoribosylaminopyrimidine deaminase/5-amino-6-(5-phosphoribosylamino)uracil reductase RibD [Aureimonas sp. N4]
MTGPDMQADDERWMAAALRLSRRHVGLTADNPSVGALIVSGDGRVVGHGVTAHGGRPHAERVALAEAGSAARGATAYVTLEPCAHHGRTSPCADALVEAGVRRVVYGAGDPDPRVNGKGAAILRRAGVLVDQLLQPNGERAFEGFLSRIRRRRPFVTLKMAVSSEGFVGRMGEGQVAISGAIARRQTHLLRAETDAILVGVGTALADRPLLTCRLPGLEARSPRRIVLDRHLRLPLDHPLIDTAESVPTFIATDVAEAARLAPFAARKARIISAGAGDLSGFLISLVPLGIATLLLEGGPILAQSFLEADLVDRVILVRSRHGIGGPGVAMPAGLNALSGFIRQRDEEFGDDRWIEWERSPR